MRTDAETQQQTIAELQAAVQAAIDKQKSAKDEIKRLEKDMAEFKEGSKRDETIVSALSLYDGLV